MFSLIDFYILAVDAVIKQRILFTSSNIYVYIYLFRQRLKMKLSENGLESVSENAVLPRASPSVGVRSYLARLQLVCTLISYKVAEKRKTNFSL